MNRILFTLYRVLVPKPFRTSILKRSLRQKILSHYAQIPVDQLDEDQKEILRFLENNPVSIFPYEFQSGYLPENIEVHTDSDNGMKYVWHDGKRLYFRKRWNIKRVRKSYSELSKEQDPDSPHRYITGEFFPDENDVVADIGAAEGNFSLPITDKVRKIYLFEYDREWIKALEATFKGWEEKVVIIPKYVSDFDDAKHVRIDTFMETNNDITFLKIDVDGNEQKVLNGCRSLLEGGRPLKIALCTYHGHNDERDFSKMLRDHGFNVWASKGYMINYYDKKIKAPWFRRGLIRAIRE